MVSDLGALSGREVGDAAALIRYREAGDPSALDALFARHGGFVTAVARRSLGNLAGDADDAAQAVFVLLMRRAAAAGRSASRAGSLRPWLHRATVLTCRSLCRSAARRHRREAAVGVPADAAVPPTPAAESAIDAEFNRLSRGDREALSLRYFDDLSHAEVGRALGVGEEAAKKRVRRALSRLRERLVRRGVAGMTAVGASGLLADSAAANPACLFRFTSQVAGPAGGYWAMSAAAAVLLAGALGAAAFLLTPRPIDAAPSRPIAEKPPPFHWRAARKRAVLWQLMRAKGGDPKKAQKAIDRGLAWLAKRQRRDGSWRGTPQAAGYPIGITGLALMAFLGDGHAPDRGPHRKAVARGFAFLLSQQTPAGGFRGDMNYEAGIAAVALCEGHGMTGDAKLGAAARKALKHLAAAQLDSGGWTYKSKGAGRGDTSNTGWPVQAFRAARAARLPLPEGSMKQVMNYLDTVACAEGAKYGYIRRDARVSMTSVGLTCRRLAGWHRTHADSYAAGLKYISETEPRRGRANAYADYYAAQVACDDFGRAYRGGVWPAARDFSLKAQRADGSWGANAGVYLKATGPVGTTAIRLLILETPLRYPPTAVRRRLR